MTLLQQQAVKLVMQIPDDSSVRRLISFIENMRFAREAVTAKVASEKKAEAFNYLNTVWDSISKYYPDGIDEAAEYEEAMKERYGYTG